MEKKVKCLEVRTPDDRPICTILMYEKEVGSQKAPDHNNCASSKGTQKQNTKSPNGSNGDLMTQAQKRYLFKLLAEQGKEGEEAHEYLKGLFQVDTLKDVLKADASRVIGELLKEQDGGGPDDRPPF